MTIRTLYGGIHALELHSESFGSGFAHLPGLKIVFPSSPAETKGLLTSVIRDPDPVIFMESMRLYRSFFEEILDDHEIPFGEARIVESGDDRTVIASGTKSSRKVSYVSEIVRSFYRCCSTKPI
ncbi:hypothetical protein [Natronococcus wangiae]|uniref:hypothetical protein n=1 Tax=Natronococcus wangiae TaxID=3068275 RepID=UPI00313386FF